MTDELLDRLRNSRVVGRYFEPDGSLVVVSGGDESAGDGGGEGGSEGGEGSGSGESQGASGGQGGESGTGDSGQDNDGGEKKLELTQAELDKMIDKRLGRAKAKWESELKDYSDAENQTETERLQSEKEAAERAAQERTDAANQRLVLADAKVAAVTAGAKSDRVTALLKLVDLSDIDVDDDGNVDAKAVEKAVKAGLDEYPEFKASASGGKGGNSGGTFNGGHGDTKPSNLEEAVAARYS